MTNYELNIISRHSQFDGKTLKKYNVEGIDTIGAYGNEEFIIQFKNNTWQKVQIILSLDGTNILTGKLADTEINNDMWVVNGYSSLTLSAFPETDNGGAAFVFTSADKSVAVHTHGDLSNRGIIAAAVFVEGHVEPIRYNLPPIVITHPVYPHYYPHYDYYWFNNNQVICHNNVVHSNSMLCSQQSVSLNSCSTADSATFGSIEETKSLESLAAVGAGQYTNQQISHVAGLIKPTFAETVRVRYVWWDMLVEKLKSNNVPAAHASGFPGNKKQTNINLGNTPRIGGHTQPAFPREQAPVYTRV